MTTLFEVTLALAKALGIARTSVTTAAGSATTAVDNTRTEVADYWNGGTLWFGGSPVQSRVITDWALTGTTFTYPTTTSAVGSGVPYTAATKDWPRDQLIAAVSDALRGVAVPDYDTSLTTVAEQTRYALPAGVYNVKEVAWGNALTAPINYPLSYNWREIDGYIEFDAGKQPMLAGYGMRLTYMAAHAAIAGPDSDVISPYVHLDWLIAEAETHAYRWMVQQTGGKESSYYPLWKEALDRAVEMRRRHPIPTVHRSARTTL